MTRLTALTVLLVAHAATPSPLPTKAELAAQYRGLNLAFTHHDVIGAAKYMRPDYVCTLRGGIVLRREDFLKRVFATMGTLSNSKSWTAIDSIRITPSGVFVTAHRFVIGTQKLADRRLHAIKLISKYEDFWVRDGKRWLLRRSALSAAARYIDGKLDRTPRVAFGRAIQAQR